MRPWYRFCRFGCQVFFTAMFRGRVFGIRRVPRTGGVLLVCNHQSYLDPIFATLALPRECHYMARDTLFKNPLFKRLIDSVNAFPIKRGTADIGAIKETLRRLKAGQLVATFPEGTRTRDGSIGPMHPGMILLARKARVPIVPAVVIGAFQAWPRQATLPRPHGVVVAYGEPLAHETMTGLPDDDCTRLVRERIVALMEQYRRHPVLGGSQK
jgi:1-acyl-sn-glycerol-3-phosphate acyltransferase